MRKAILGWFMAGTLLVGCGGEPARDVELTESAEQTVDLAQRELRIEGYNGTLTVAGHNDSTAVLHFEKRARGADEEEARRRLAGIAIDARERGDAYVLRLRSEQAGETSVDVRTEVPYKTPLRLHTESGAVAVEAMAGPIHVEVNNGAVTIKGAAHNLDVRTDNGDLTVAMVGFRADTEVRLRSNNGAVELALPPSTSATVEVETQVGTLELRNLSLGEKVEEKTATGGKVKGVLGNGTGRIVVQTNNGPIVVRSGS